MDRNALTGLLLIGAILIGYTYFSAPSEEEKAAFKAQQDSIAAVQKAEAEAEQALSEVGSQTVESTETAQTEATPTTFNDSLLAVQDSMANLEAYAKYGDFAPAAEERDEEYVIENNLLKLTLSAKGGRPIQAQLKEYQTYDSLPLYLFDEDSSAFGLAFSSQNRMLRTADLYFSADQSEVVVSEGETKSIKLKMPTRSEGQFIEFVYTLSDDSYLVDYKVNFVGLTDLVTANQQNVRLDWSMKSPDKEKDISNQVQKTTMFYEFEDGDVDYIWETSDERIALEEPVKWISFKQQYFSVALINNTGSFKNENLEVESRSLVSENYVKYLAASVPLAIDPASQSIDLDMYMGPNKFKILEATGIGLEEQIDLGWGIFGWVSEYLVIPVFNILEDTGLSYGIIILILTILIKMALMPLTYKNYVSSAKQRVLKPQMEELNEKYKNADPMKKQQEVMALYRETGVNPFAGCIPMILQMPILYAMFRFFPASIELRQESFLWAEDLSTFDTFISLPFTIPVYGSHISLFTLLLSVSVYLYAKFNMSMAPSMGDNNQAAQIQKMSLYMSPIFMLVFFNSYAAALSYYYFTANIISVFQQIAIKRWFIDEEAILAKLQANKKKPKKGKSKFQRQLEEMQKKQQENKKNKK